MSKTDILNQMDTISSQQTAIYCIGGALVFLCVVVFILCMLEILPDDLDIISRISVFFMVAVIIGSAIFIVELYNTKTDTLEAYKSEGMEINLSVVEVDGIEYMEDGDKLVRLEGLEVRQANVKEKYVLVTKVEAVPEYNIEEEYLSTILYVPASR